jgi:hypothetical protein
MKRDRVQVILILSSLLIILLAAFHLSVPRFIPGYNLPKLKSDMTRYVQTDFVNANKQLQAYGFKPVTISPNDISCYNSQDSLSTKNYDSCSISSLEASTVTADAPFIAHWRQTSSQLERWFLQHGWRKTWNEKQPISEILDKPHNDGSIGVNYERKHKHLTCTVSIMWVQPRDPNQLEVEQHCDGSI